MIRHTHPSPTHPSRLSLQGEVNAMWQGCALARITGVAGTDRGYGRSLTFRGNGVDCVAISLSKPEGIP